MKSYLNVFKPQSLTLTVLAAGAAFVGFTQASQAGFEWIPPKPAPQAQPAPEPLKVKPMTAPQEEMSAPADEAFLPIPSDEPVVETQPTVEAQPLQADDMASPAAAEDSAPMPITARPEQQQIKTLHVGQTEPMEDKTAAMPMVEPADDVMTPAPEQPTKAVMPADTPENVKQASLTTQTVFLSILTQQAAHAALTRKFRRHFPKQQLKMRMLSDLVRISHLPWLYNKLRPQDMHSPSVKPSTPVRKYHGMVATTGLPLCAA